MPGSCAEPASERLAEELVGVGHKLAGEARSMEDPWGELVAFERSLGNRCFDSRRDGA